MQITAFSSLPKGDYMKQLFYKVKEKLFEGYLTPKCPKGFEKLVLGRYLRRLSDEEYDELMHHLEDDQCKVCLDFMGFDMPRALNEIRVNMSSGQPILQCSKSLEEISIRFASGIIAEKDEKLFVRHLEIDQCEACCDAIDFLYDVSESIEANLEQIIKDFRKNNVKRCAKVFLSRFLKKAVFVWKFIRSPRSRKKKCPRQDLHELIADYFDGQLTPEEEVEIIAHSRICEEFQNDLETMLFVEDMFALHGEKFKDIKR